jgi:hypothetical protein
VLLFSQILKSLPFKKSSNIPLSIKSLNQNPRPTEKTRKSVVGIYRRNEYEIKIKSNWFREEKDKQIDFLSHFIPDVYNEDISLLRHKSKLQHAREMTINFESNRSLIIQFDQGVGYWETVEEASIFPFEDELHKQIKWAEEKIEELELTNLDNFGTPLIISYPVNENENNK